MKQLLITVAVVCLLTGCGQDKTAESERKLAEAQQKLEEATKALEEARGAAAKDAAAATKVAEAREHVKRSADQVQTAAKTVKSSVAETKTDDRAVETAKKAEAAEAKAEEARKIAEPPKIHTLPAGTTVSVRTQTQLSSKTNESGSAFEANLAAPLEVDGYVVAPKGSTVRGVVSESDDGGRVKGKASMTLALRSIVLPDGKAIDVRTEGVTQVAQQTKKKDALKIGIASGVGAAIGAIAGGGKGAAIGAGAGAAGGTGMVLATKGEAAVIPSESVLTFRLTAPITVQEARR